MSEPRKVYVAASWRTKQQPEVVRWLREAGHEVYDFREPAPGVSGFAWREIDGGWQSWTPEQYRAALRHPVAQLGFSYDEAGLATSDTCVLVLPSGRSAHAEAGWMKGSGARTIVYIAEPIEPELMYLLFDEIALTKEELLTAVRAVAAGAGDPPEEVPIAMGALQTHAEVIEWGKGIAALVRDTEGWSSDIAWAIRRSIEAYVQAQFDVRIVHLSSGVAADTSPRGAGDRPPDELEHEIVKDAATLVAFIREVHHDCGWCYVVAHWEKLARERVGDRPPAPRKEPWEPTDPWQVIQRAPAIWDVVRMRGEEWDSCCGFPLGGLARDVCSALNKAERAVRPPPRAPTEAAITAAERAYWTDYGVSIHNLGAALRAAYEIDFGASPAAAPPPEEP